MEQEVPAPTEAGLDERRAVQEEAEAGEILSAWDIKDRWNEDRGSSGTRIRLRAALLSKKLSKSRKVSANKNYEK